MKRQSMLMGLGTLAVAAGCSSHPPPALDDEVDDDGARLAGYFIARRDPTVCAPGAGTACGGFWLSPVNGGTMRCLDGAARTRCYAAAMDLSALALSPEAEAAVEALTQGAADSPAVIVRGSVAPAAAHANGVFVAREVWRASRPAPLNGAVVRVSAQDRALAVARVNTPLRELVAALDLSDAPLDDDAKAAGEAAVRSTDGVLAVGLHAFAEGPDGNAVPTFHATQLYHRVTDDDDALPARPTMLPPPLPR